MRKLIHSLINKQERELGASLDWLRDLADVSLSAVFKFALVTPLGNHRSKAVGKFRALSL